MHSESNNKSLMITRLWITDRAAGHQKKSVGQKSFIKPVAVGSFKKQ
jgi:hypothetical protein